MFLGPGLFLMIINYSYSYIINISIAILLFLGYYCIYNMIIMMNSMVKNELQGIDEISDMYLVNDRLDNLERDINEIKKRV